MKSEEREAEKESRSLPEKVYKIKWKLNSKFARGERSKGNFEGAKSREQGVEAAARKPHSFS